jgi:hypothetical protein
MVFCHNINGLFKELKQEHNSSDWQLFIDCSQRSLKAVFLHNRNSKPSIAIAHSVHLMDTYDNIKLLVEAIQYNVHEWNMWRPEGDSYVDGCEGRLYEVLLLLMPLG